jgi:acetate kinase
MTSTLADFLIHSVPLFRDFPAERLEALLAGSRIETFAAKEPIKKFGGSLRFLGVLIEGRAEVSVTDDGGLVHPIDVIEAGDVFGEMSLMTGDKSSADVVAVSHCQALLIPEEMFAAKVLTFMPAIHYLSKLITERLRKASADGTGAEIALSAVKRSDDPYGLGLKNGHRARLLVINCGSSSLKYNLFDTENDGNNARGLIERIGEDHTRHIYRAHGQEIVRELPTGTYRDAVQAMLAELVGEAGVIASPGDITAVGHRVVHGGDTFTDATVIDDKVIAEIERFSSLAPLHNPVNLTGIREARALLPDVPHVAVFDTAFHHTLPAYAYLYGLPYELYEQKKIRRYGFHGMSHAYVSLKAAEALKKHYSELAIVTCHLGNGASMCAIDHGRSVDTSMGMTPAQGLLMGTRCGDVDAGVLVHLMRSEGMDANAIDKLINKFSGLRGLSGVSNDMREVEQAAADGNPRALLAFKTFCYSLRKYVGAYAAAMGDLDCLVFTGGIGQGSAGVRWLACQGLQFMGIKIDEARNQAADGHSLAIISTDDSPITVMVVPTDEERMIARETMGAMKRAKLTGHIKEQEPAPIPIEVSAHHVHLAQEDVEALFGAGHTLHNVSELSQPGQYACEEKVALVGPKGRIDNVRVLGPTRKETQVEIAMTEQFKLGIHPPIRESGDLKGTPGCVLEGPAGRVELKRGVICAQRHIHMSPDDALKMGLRDRYVVRIRVEGDRELIFGDVVVRVNPNFRLAMHIDTDEANAAHINTGMIGYIESVQRRAR